MAKIEVSLHLLLKTDTIASEEGANFQECIHYIVARVIPLALAF
jgi:hypothetical protein